MDEHGQTTPSAALEELRLHLHTRHYSYRTECTYADWVRRFFAYQLRIKDLDFDQGLVFIRSGKGDKDRSTLLVEVGREELHSASIRRRVRNSRSTWATRTSRRR